MQIANAIGLPFGGAKGGIVKNGLVAEYRMENTNISPTEVGLWSQGSFITAGAPNRIKSDAYISASVQPYILSWSGGYNMAVLCYNASQAQLSDSGWKTSPYTFTPPANTVFMRVTARKIDDGNLTPDDISIIKPFLAVASQTLWDSWSDKHGTLGSTANADTNDPQIVATGLLNGADDYTQLPYSIDVQQDFTVLLVADVAASAPTVGEWLWSCGRRTTGTPYLGINRASDGNLLLQSRNDASTTAYITLAAANVVPGVRAIVAKRSSEQGSIVDVVSKQSGSGAIPSSPITCDRMTLGALGRDGVGGFYHRNFYYLALYNRALTDAEIQRNYHYIKRLMAKRGVSI